MLNRLKSLKKPIRGSIIGAGAMEKGLMYQCAATPGMRIHSLSTIFRLGKEGKKKLKLLADYQLKSKWGFIEDAKILNPDENKSHHRRQFQVQRSRN